jgi:hypothetical protein
VYTGDGTPDLGAMFCTTRDVTPVLCEHTDSPVDRVADDAILTPWAWEKLALVVRLGRQHTPVQ